MSSAVSRDLPHRTAIGGPHMCVGVWIVLGVLALAQAAAPPDEFRDRVRPVLEQHCYGCHSGPTAKAGIDLKSVQDAVGLYREPRVWREVVTQLRERSMPPKAKPQPAEAERDMILNWVEAELANLEAGRVPKDPGRTVLRRLSRSEYNHTVQDLFGITNRPADSFPADGGGGAGFDNNAATLFIPPILMERLMAAAEEVVGSIPMERLLIARPTWWRGERTAARRVIEHYAPRIFRTSLAAGELTPYLALYQQQRQQGQPFESALRQCLKAMLVSPRFLYRIEQDQNSAEPYRVTDHELANRLSYFLWASMPDDALFEVARSGRLSQPDVLSGQVDRMLDDPRARALSEDFVTQWLGIRQLRAGTEPDPSRFPHYTLSLREAMIEEPVRFFDDLLRSNGSLLQLLAADYVIVNSELARHYQLVGEGADANTEWRRFLVADQTRGGVLGMGAVLTLTSYPLRTSPVLRGKWVLEEILGAPTPPPPPMVKGLPPDDTPKEGLTFRQQLEKHRSDPSCAGCHRRMDPLGFGLENYDPTGRWRTEVGGVPVDAAGLLATGEPFKGPGELKRKLMERKLEFVRNLTERMLSYALGRGLEYYDTPEVQRMVAAVAAHAFQARSLVNAIVHSYPFQYRRNPPVQVASP